LEGELDNTTPGKVTGWMRFAGIKEQVTFDLKDDFHRDIRGAKIRFSGDGNGADLEEAAKYMDGIVAHQTGKVGDITAGRRPHDYGHSPYIEWYGEDNGRVVLELEPEQVSIIGQPIPWQSSAPISWHNQQQNMANFLVSICQAVQAPAVAVGRDGPIVSDPQFSHWVVAEGQIIGEAYSVEKVDGRQSSAFVRLFAMPEMAEHGHIATNQLRAKQL
jgi:hypothetical protein